jgi:hypothetical protein
MGGIGTLVVVAAAVFVFPQLRTLGSLSDIRPAPSEPSDNTLPSATPSSSVG